MSFGVFIAVTGLFDRLTDRTTFFGSKRSPDGIFIECDDNCNCAKKPTKLVASEKAKEPVTYDLPAAWF